jgi:hypothetical protein
MKKMGIEPVAQPGVGIDAAAQRTTEIDQSDIRIQLRHQVLGQEFLTEIRERRTPFQAVIGGRDRAARYAGNDADVVEKIVAIAIARRRARKLIEHAIGECRRPRAAAGKCKADNGAGVLTVRLFRAGQSLGGLRWRHQKGCGGRRVERQIVDGRAGAEPERGGHHKKHATRTHLPTKAGAVHPSSRPSNFRPSENLFYGAAVKLSSFRELAATRRGC